jgi:glycosyltransferase involved in cell wall biosynthesis
MRILQLKTSTCRGGAETIVLHFTRRAVARGHEVLTVFSEPGWLEEEFKQRGLPARVLPMSSASGVQRMPALLGLLWRFRPDVVLNHGARVNIFGTLAARLAGVPSVSVEHCVDDWRETSPRLNNLDRLCARFNTHRIAVSKAVYRMLVDRHILPPERISLIPNAVELPPALSRQREALQARFGFSPDNVVAVTTARLVPAKGHRYLLEAMAGLRAEFPRLRLLFLGDGEARATLEAQRDALGLAGSVFFAGSVGGVLPLLTGCDLFVLPSLWEGMPVALLEAMAVGLPVLATRVDGTPEVITDGETGLLVPPRDPGALADGLRRLLTDDALCARLAAAGQAHVRAAYDIETLVDRYLEVLCDARKEGRYAA